MANVVRICARYGNLSILEDAYGINLRPLATVSYTHLDVYKRQPMVPGAWCVQFHSSFTFMESSRLIGEPLKPCLLYTSICV